MLARISRPLAYTFLLAGATLIGAGCETQGPAEKAGEAIDKGARDVKDTVSPPGPGEKAGRAVDDAVNK